MTTLTADVSHHDVDRRGGAPVEWGAVASHLQQGEVGCARVSYGDPAGFAPPSRHGRTHLRGMVSAGYKAVGGYHNLVRGDASSLRRQVDHLRRELDAGGGNWGMLDVEAYPELVSRGIVPRWVDVLGFAERWRAVDSRVLVGYIPRWVHRDILRSPDLRAWPGGPIVNAHYRGGVGSAHDIYARAGGDTGIGWGAYGGRTPDGWQYTSSATVPGASGGATDVNAWRMDALALVRLLVPAPILEDDDMPLFGRLTDDGSCFVSNGPSRYGFARVEDLYDAMASWGRVTGRPAKLIDIDRARLAGYGVDLAGVADGASVTLTDAQAQRLAESLRASAPTFGLSDIERVVDRQLDQQSLGGADDDL